MLNNVKIFVRLLFLALLSIAAVAALWSVYSGRHLSAGEFRYWVNGFGAYAPVVFVAVYAISVTFGFPAMILTVVGGLLFGKVTGTALNVIAATVGASGAFWVSRIVARDFVARRFSGMRWFRNFELGVARNGFYYILFIRLLPILPFNGINFASGITSLSYRDFLFATLIGIAPHTFILTNVAVEAGETAAHGFRVSPGLMLAFFLLALFGVLPVIAKKYLERRKGAV